MSMLLRRDKMVICNVFLHLCFGAETDILNMSATIHCIWIALPVV